MTQIEKADPTSLAIQMEISDLVIQRVADQATYTIRFKNSPPITGISAKGAEELYQQCCMKRLCPELALVRADDKVIDGHWIVDGVWRATWQVTGETYTIDARGSQPYSGAESDVANRIAYGKAKRNAHLAAVPSVLREAFLDALTKKTGTRVVETEEYADRQDRNPPNTARASGRRQTVKAKEPHQIVYEHLAAKWKVSPQDKALEIFAALGDKTLPSFLDGGTPEEAIALIDNYWQNGGSTDPVVVTAEEAEQALLEEGE
jgi:hypothetical protein